MTTALAVPAVAQVNVTVNAARAVRIVDSRTFGLNTAVWDGSFSDPQSLTTLRKAGVKFLRYPGGSTADNFSWQTSTPVLSAWTVNNFVTYADFDSFAASAVAIGAEVVITTNYVTGSAQDAAAWVAYSNVTKGYGFKYWEVGNECYGLYEYDPPLTGSADAQQYAMQAVQYIQAMKAVDPTVKVGVTVDASEDSLTDGTTLSVINPVTGVSHSGWTPIVLTTMKNLGVLPDFLIYHYYDQNAGLEDDALLLQDSQIWSVSSQELRSILSDYLGAAGAGIEMLVTENNSVDTNPGKQTTSLVNGLFLADSVGSLMQTEYNALVWWDFHNGQQSNFNNSGSLYGWRQYGDFGIESHAHDPYPTYYAMELMKNFATGGDLVVTASSDNDQLSAYAAKRLKGTLSILVINKSPTNTYPVNFAVSGFSPRPIVNVFSYGIPQDNAAKLGTGSPDVAASTFTNGGNAFSESIAPYSLTLLSLSSTASPPTTVSEPVSQTVGVGSTAVFSFAAVGAPALSFQWFLNDQVILSATSSTLVVKDATSADAGSYTCVASNSSGSVTSSAATLSLVNTTNLGHLINISCRGQVGTAGNVMIAGFVIGGDTSKTVLVRASGPALTAFGVTGTLPDPTLQINNAGGVLATNKGWGGDPSIAAAAVSVGAFSWGSVATADSALLVTLAPGAYTAEVSGASGDSGVALVEVYDVP